MRLPALLHPGSPPAGGTPAADAPPGASFGARARFHLVRWALLVGVALAVYLVFPSPTTQGAPALEVGQVPEHDVVAPFSYIVTKTPEEYTREGDVLADAVRPVFFFSSAAYDSALTSLQLFFEAVAEAEGQPGRIWAIAQGYDLELEDGETEWLADGERREAVRAALTSLLGGALSRGTADAGVVRAEASPTLLIRRGDGERVVARDSVGTFADLVQRADAMSRQWQSPAAQQVVRRLAVAFYVPTLVPDHATTLARREQARRSVDSVRFFVRAGERVATAGEMLTPEANVKLKALAERMEGQPEGRLATRSLIGSVLYNAIIASPFWLLLLLYRRRVYDDLRQIGFIAGVFVLVAAFTALLLSLFPDRPELLPVPLAAMLVAVLFDSRLAAIGAMTLAILLGGQWALRDSNALFFGLIGGVAAAAGMRAMRRRHILYLTIGVVILAYGLGAVTMGLLLDWSLEEVGASMLAGLVGALGCGALAMLLLPLAETTTRVTTHLTLLELSDFRRPLLRRLALEAPGTWAHSISMANLCEAACDAIGADGLLARVGCYYHDIGKLEQPQYFIENQRPGANPHDALPPDESARIIRRHVTEGLRLADEAQLPPDVRAFIPEHHGTTEIRIFLHRARRAGLPIRTEDFRYPGPRPRTAETAIAMLADAAEAAVRVLHDPTPADVKEAIEQLVAQRVGAGQLDDTPITLRELDRVKAEFVRVLAGIHHNRVEYPRASGALPLPPDTARLA